MNNEEKAQEICEKNKRFKVECSSLECYLSAMEMAEWKDQQFAEQKQQLIEKACEWLYDNIGGNIDSRISLDTFIDDFKKAMEK